MNKETVLQNGTFLVYLASCSLSGATPTREMLQGMDMEQLYRLSKFHSMQGIAKMGLDVYLKNGGSLSPDTEQYYAKFKLAYEKSIKKLVAFSFEREALYAFFEELKMPYLPLKGIVLCRYYPRIGMRQMTDNDILISQSKAKQIRSFMKQKGYKVYSFGIGCHDIYCSENLTFEFHRTLTPETLKDGAAARFCREAVERARKNAGGKLLLAFSPEDFYLYQLLHTYKHFENAGTGLRSLMDIYVMRHMSGLSFDRAYIDKELSALGITAFANSMEQLADLLFGTDPEYLKKTVATLPENLLSLYLLLINSGTFGTDEQQMKKSLLKVAKGKNISFFTKIKYLLTRIFPPYRLYRERYPHASKWVVTIPILWFVRLLSAIFFPRSAMRELETLKEAERKPSATTKE